MALVQFCVSDLWKGHLRSHDDVMRSICVFANNFWYDWDRDMGHSPMCLSCSAASSIDVQYDLLRSNRDLTWGQILKLTFRGEVLYGSIRLDDTNTIVPIKVMLDSGFSDWLDSCDNSIDSTLTQPLTFLNWLNSDSTQPLICIRWLISDSTYLSKSLIKSDSQSYSTHCSEK